MGKSPLDADLFVEPGAHELVVTAAGFVTHSQKVTAQKGGVHALRVSLEREAKAAEPKAGGAEPKGSEPVGPVGDGGGGSKPSKVPSYVAIGAGVIGLAAGIGFLVAASGKESDKDDALAQIPGSNKCGSGTVAPDKCAEVESLADDAKRLRTYGFVGFGVAAAGGVLGYLLWPRSSGSSTGTVIVPSFARGTTSLHLQGHF
ncbi:MAG: hypothetical protein HYZ29_26965 [Myxococcales bacterium]|nr:hypothetical protein [Myxococcales bacterium]